MMRFFKKHETFKTKAQNNGPKVVTFTLAIVYSDTGSQQSYARHEAINRAFAHLKHQIEKAIPENAQCTLVSGHKPETVQ